MIAVATFQVFSKVHFLNVRNSILEEYFFTKRDSFSTASSASFNFEINTFNSIACRKMGLRTVLILTMLILIGSNVASGLTLEVGPGKTYANPSQAAANAQPGDTILIYPFEYRGTFFIRNLNGTEDQWITILGVARESVVFRGGTEGLHFSNISYVRIGKLSFTEQTGNGMNIDDGGVFDQPSHHVNISDCHFYRMNAQGNNDFLKLSGLEDFWVENCLFEDGANGGSAIDMVGCHRGWIGQNHFYRMGSNCIQAKGGTQYIRIEANWFQDGGQRTLNLGGSTGLEFFRPQNARFEAADLEVYSNVFIGSWAPVAYVGAVRIVVANNTFYRPQNWVIRILQETVDTMRFFPCGDNAFINNVIVTNQSLSRHVNIGPNTAPETFVFSHNLWFNEDDPTQSRPVLPVPEQSQLHGEDPLLLNVDQYELNFQDESPAKHSGFKLMQPELDYNGMPFHMPPSRGAFEYETPGSENNIIANEVYLRVFPNPIQVFFFVEVGAAGHALILNQNGHLIHSWNLTKGLHFMARPIGAAGVYFLFFRPENGNEQTVKLNVLK
jgi:hypothetical protein